MRKRRRFDGGVVTAARYRATTTEAAMQAAIEYLVALRGGVVWSVRDSRGLRVENMPDLIILDPRGRRIILVELKSQSRVVTVGQAAVIDMASECQDAYTFIVRPEPRDPGELSYDAFLDWLNGGGSQ